MFGPGLSTGWLLQRPWVALAAALIIEATVLVVGRGDSMTARSPRRTECWFAGRDNDTLRA